MRKLAIFSAGYATAVFAAVLILPRGALLPLGGFCAALAVLLWMMRELLPERRRRCALLCSCGLAAGMLWTWGYGQLFLEPVRALDDSTVVLTGTVKEYPQATQYGGKVLIRADRDCGNVLALVYIDEAYMDLVPGERISTVAHCTLATRSMGGEEISYFTAKGIFLTAVAYGQLTRESPEKVPLSAIPARMTRRLQQSIERVLPADAAALTGAIVTGNREGLSDSFTTSLQRTGLSHTVAVSGMHLAFFAGFFALLFGQKKRRTVLLSVPLILLFTLMAACTPSVVRAAVMIILMQLAPLLNREGDSPTSLGFALLLLLMHNPYAAANVGLQLSFAAVAGILLFSGRMQERMLERFAPSTQEKRVLSRILYVPIRFVVSVVSVTLGALVFTTPLSAYYFGQVSLIAPIANLLTLWAVTGVFVGGMLVGALGLAWPGAAALFGAPVTGLARYLDWVIEGMGRFSLASIPMTNPYYLLWLLFLYGVLVLFLILPGKKRVRVPVFLSAVTLAAALVLTNLSFHAGAMSVQVLDVGQGQSVLLRSGTHIALVDCGGDSHKNAGDIAADYIQSLGRSTLDLLVISHYHDDHANGIPELLERIDVKEIALPDVEEDSKLRQRILEQAEQQETVVRFVREDTRLPFGTDTVFTMYPPFGQTDTNELALTVLCSAGDYDVLLTGDMGTATEKELVAYADLPDVELMVAGHHGSKYSNSELLLETVRPDVAVFSVGADNHYGHPTPEAMARFEAVGAQMYRTDLNGTVTVTVQPDLTQEVVLWP